MRASTHLGSFPDHPRKTKTKQRSKDGSDDQMEEELSRIVYDVADLYQQQQSLDEFLSEYTPTHVSQSQASWICIHGAARSPRPGVASPWRQRAATLDAPRKCPPTTLALAAKIQHTLFAFAWTISPTKQTCGESLRDMGFTRRLAFKADAYTHVGIYSGNERGISPSIYNA